MNTIHWYVTRQILAAVAMTVVIFTFVLLLGNLLKEIFALLLGGQVSIATVLWAIGLLIPYVLVFALPLGVLTATLLVFGRLSADQELTALRSSGISLISLASPVLLLSVGFSLLCAVINMEWAPYCRTAYKELLFQVGAQGPTGFLREKEYLQNLPGGYVFIVGKINGTNLHEVEVHQSNPKDGSESWFRAPRGALMVDVTSRVMTLVLSDAYGAVWKGEDLQVLPNLGEMVITNAVQMNAGSSPTTKLSDMSFAQLRRKTEEMEAFSNRLPPDVIGRDPVQNQKIRRFRELRSDLSMPARVQMHRQVSFSFASIGFALIGIPLAIRAHRRETTAGIAIALVLVLLYYSFIILGQALDNHSEFFPHLILWLPNFLFQMIGGCLLYVANRRG